LKREIERKERDVEDGEGEEMIQVRDNPLY
jgi:hypothetical protein